MVDIQLLSVFSGSSLLIGMSILWAVAGIAAFIYSLVCVGKTQSLMRAILGIVLAAFLGPLYWIYWFYDKEYCRA
jgi:hypothetical protein